MVVTWWLLAFLSSEHLKIVFILLSYNMQEDNHLCLELVVFLDSWTSYKQGDLDIGILRRSMTIGMATMVRGQDNLQKVTIRNTKILNKDEEYGFII